MENRDKRKDKIRKKLTWKRIKENGLIQKKTMAKALHGSRDFSALSSTDMHDRASRENTSVSFPSHRRREIACVIRTLTLMKYSPAF